jgi:glyoxylase-like metal-dependent hydrolase (beta-lactamase superfamily II)
MPLPDHPTLPHGVTLLERGWLSSNNILLVGTQHCALVDSGYATHASQTLALVSKQLHGRPLDVLVNTHLHSDHCGGNAALQAHYPKLQTLIPSGQAAHVTAWDPYALSYTPTGQQCERFSFSTALQPGTELLLADKHWQVHAAPGHDPNSVILFEPESRLLLSADALWGNGFGVVFPELDGDGAFSEVSDTLDLIESLHPGIVIPGHGSAFSDVHEALARARRRLNSFANDPAKHRHYAAKVMVKFRLLEVQTVGSKALLAWATTAHLLVQLHHADAPHLDFDNWIGQLVDELVASGAAAYDQSIIRNAG